MLFFYLLFYSVCFNYIYLFIQLANLLLLQVLPPDMMLLAEPSPEDLLAAVEQAINRVPHLDPLKQHKRVGGAPQALTPCTGTS